MHHQGTITSSQMMIANSAHPELRDLARRIQESQQRQIVQLRAWRQQWLGTSAESMLPLKDRLFL